MNSMYVPFQGTLDQVYNLVRTIKASSTIEFNQEDNQIIIKPYLEIKIPLMATSHNFLQFKWVSCQESDELADNLAQLIDKITPEKLMDIEKGRRNHIPIHP